MRLVDQLRRASAELVRHPASGQDLDALTFDGQQIRTNDVVLRCLGHDGGRQLGVGDVDVDAVDAAADGFDLRLAHLHLRHLVGLVERERHVAVAQLLVHEARRQAPLGLLPAAHLDLAELRMIEFLPLDVLVPELEEVVEVVLAALSGDRAVGVLLLLDQRGAVEVLATVPQLIRERQHAEAIVGPVDEPAVDGVEAAPDHEVAVVRKHPFTLRAKLVVDAHIGAGILALPLRTRSAQDHAAVVVVRLHAGNVRVHHEKVVDRLRFGQLERVIHRAALDVFRLPVGRPVAIAVVAADRILVDAPVAVVVDALAAEQDVVAGLAWRHLLEEPRILRVPPQVPLSRHALEDLLDNAIAVQVVVAVLIRNTIVVIVHRHVACA